MIIFFIVKTKRIKICRCTMWIKGDEVTQSRDLLIKFGLDHIGLLLMLIAVQMYNTITKVQSLHISI